MTKYNNKKVVLDGHTFDSKAEARRYQDLKILQRAGGIKDLELQPVFVLAPVVRLRGATRNKPALRYRGDFRYTNLLTNEVVIEDVKGIETEAFKIKQHLMKAFHGIDIHVVGIRR